MNSIYSHITKLLYNAGARNVCISPGLRNSEFSLSFITQGNFNCYSIVDERSAAYFALGMALKTNSPTVLVCTSGTAVANYLPAIIEANHSRIPMIIITADRPTHLLNSGENQTIHQKDIYANFVRESIDIDINNDFNSILNDIHKALQFVSKKNSSVLPGPIHINIHVENFINQKSTKKSKYIHKKQNKIPPHRFNWSILPFEDIFNLYTRKRPLIIIGKLNNKLNGQLINQLSNHLKAAVLVDSLSQMRFNNKKSFSLYDNYVDKIEFMPDLIIRIGQKPVSKKLCEKIKSWEKNDNKMVLSSLLIDQANRFNDDCLTTIPCDYKDFIDVIINSTPENTNSDFYNHIMNLENRVYPLIKKEEQWSELAISKVCLASIKNNGNLFIGNSMPIRYIDMIGKLSNDININTYSNRGASGIDGVISTALGVSACSNKHNMLLIGDLSFLHDQNALLIAKQYNIDLTVIIINNNGGGIFSLLPISESVKKKEFNTYWTTPQNIDLKKICTTYDMKYSKVDTIQKLKAALKKYKNLSGIRIIDAQINIDLNKKVLNEIKNKIKKG